MANHFSSAFYQVIQIILPHLKLIECSRLIGAVALYVQLYKQFSGANQAHSEWSDLVIIDSFPVSLCQNIYSHRAKIFHGNADIDCNATKHMWFFKVHVVMEADCLILNYVIRSCL